MEKKGLCKFLSFLQYIGNFFMNADFKNYECNSLRKSQQQARSATNYPSPLNLFNEYLHFSNKIFATPMIRYYIDEIQISYNNKFSEKDTIPILDPI